MRVLVVAGSFPPEPCGVGDYTRLLAEALAAQPDTEVAVLTRGQPDAIAGQALHLLPPVSAWRFAELPAIVRRARQWRPDITHIQYPTSGFVAHRRFPLLLPLLLRLAGLRVVVTWHEPPPPPWLDPTAPFLTPLLGACGLIFVRPNYLDYFGPRIRRLVERVPLATIPNAANLPVSLLSEPQRVQLRTQLVGGQQRLVVFFGFISRHKGVAHLFEIADPQTDHLVIAGNSHDDGYLRELHALADSPRWQGRVSFRGFSPPAQAADLLLAADAVVLPFTEGGGNWNTSIHSAQAQGSFVLTTGRSARGDDPDQNLFVAAPEDIAGMRKALKDLAGRRVARADGAAPWERIARAHLDHYARCLARSV
ncbi:MAG: glycosyltransferase [Burkholderiales bacterium]